ncbi:hypothetical protein GA0115260_105381, partial [Streptomyces sp. MnatMP-M27]
AAAAVTRRKDGEAGAKGEEGGEGAGHDGGRGP